MRNSIKKLEKLLELGGTKKDIILLILSGIALILSLTKWYICLLILHGFPLYFAESRLFWRQ